MGIASPMIPERNTDGVPRQTIAISTFPPPRIRNFCILAHVDHGKTTLSDAILRRTGVLQRTGDVGCYLDKLEVEKARGITIKAQTCTFFVQDGDASFMLNLIDTPGHADFSYEVTRSLAVCEGAVLLIDANQGIQAQTMANYHAALDRGVEIIPTLSKLDSVLLCEDVGKAQDEIENAMGVFRSEILLTSARKEKGVEHLLKEIIRRFPAPSGDLTSPFRAVIFDVWPDPSSSTVRCLIRVADGTVEPKKRIKCLTSEVALDVIEVGIMYPEPVRTTQLRCGQVGYLLFVINNLGHKGPRIGETLTALNHHATPVVQFKSACPVVFSGLFPDQSTERVRLQHALYKLTSNDPSVTLTPVQCNALGQGWQLGFLGLLHMKIFKERLEQEYDETVLITPAVIQYLCRMRDGTNQKVTAHNFHSLSNQAECFLQPLVHAVVVLERRHVSDVITLLKAFRGEQVNSQNFSGNRLSLTFRLPLAAFCRGVHDRLKKLTSGYGSVEYDEPFYEECNLVKVDICVNKVVVDALSLLCEKVDALTMSRRICCALKNYLPRSTLDIPIVAKMGEKIVARETISGIKKDAARKCHAGDPTRKMKIIENQKKARKRNASRFVGGIEIDQNAIMEVMRSLM